MSLGDAGRAAPSIEPSGPTTELRRLIDWAVLARLGLDPDMERFAPDAADPIFGFTECHAALCDQLARTSLGLCWRCDQLWRKAERGADFERFCETVPERVRHCRGGALCRVCRTRLPATRGR